MIRPKLLAPLALIAALTASIGAQADAQDSRMTVNAASNVTLAGRSNVHDWACKSSTMDATIALKSGYETQSFAEIAKPITTVAVSIPVQSLKCGKGKMDDNMYKALHAKEFPDIKYVLESYDVNKALTTQDSLVARTVGQLTVAGKTNRVEIPITAVRITGGSMKAEGTIRILMTDFGIKPPVALLGTMRTRNEIQVTFHVLLDKPVVAVLTQQ